MPHGSQVKRISPVKWHSTGLILFTCDPCDILWSVQHHAILHRSVLSNECDTSCHSSERTHDQYDTSCDSSEISWAIVTFLENKNFFYDQCRLPVNPTFFRHEWHLFIFLALLSLSSTASVSGFEEAAADSFKTSTEFNDRVHDPSTCLHDPFTAYMTHWHGFMTHRQGTWPIVQGAWPNDRVHYTCDRAHVYILTCMHIFAYDQSMCDLSYIGFILLW